MNWQFSNDAPIYAQLIGQIRAGIVSGAFSPGERLPSVREVTSPFFSICRSSAAASGTACASVSSSCSPRLKSA